MHNLFFVDKAQSLSPLMKRPFLSQCDHLVNKLPHGTCPCPSGFDPTMFKELSGEASQERPSLVGRPVKFGHSPAMSHGKKPAPIINNGEMIFKTCVLCNEAYKSLRANCIVTNVTFFFWMNESFIKPNPSNKHTRKLVQTIQRAKRSYKQPSQSPYNQELNAENNQRKSAVTTNNLTSKLVQRLQTKILTRLQTEQCMRTNYPQNLNHILQIPQLN
jgi:hypothetical protein